MILELSLLWIKKRIQQEDFPKNCVFNKFIVFHPYDGLTLVASHGRVQLRLQTYKSGNRCFSYTLEPSFGVLTFMLGSKTRLQIVAIVKNIKASVLWKTQFSHQPVYTSELLTEARYMIAMLQILTQVPANGKLFWLLYWLPAAKYHGCASLWNSVWQFNWTFCIITSENTYTHLKPQQLFMCFSIGFPSTV